MCRGGDEGAEDAGAAVWSAVWDAQPVTARAVIRLAGRIELVDWATGELLREVYSTDHEPDGTLLKACGTRRASRCPSCAATYQADAYQLTAASLQGGKGVPETVATHPRLFVTFTAPSFGLVHSRRAQRRLVLPCHPTARAGSARTTGGRAAGRAQHHPHPRG